MTVVTHHEYRPSLVGDALRRRWPIVLLTAALVAGVVGLVAHKLGSTYTSTAQVLLRPTPGNALSPDSAKNAQQITVAMETEAGLVNSPPVAAYVSQLLKRTVAPASPDVDAVISANTQIVEISYTGPTAQAATQFADAYAKSFLQFRLSQTQQTLDRELRQLKAQEKVAQDNLTAAAADASVDRPTAQAVARVQLYSSRLASTQDLIGETNATDANPGAIIIPASSPTQADGISPLLLLIAGGLLGLGLGLALAIWRERTDDRIRRSPRPQGTRLPVLGYVPGGAARDGERTEAFRQIRAGVLVATFEPVVVTVAPLSPTVPLSSACYTTLELARSLSDSGRRVVVVDATAPVGGMTAWMGQVDPSTGLMSLLSAPRSNGVTDAVTAALQQVDGLSVISAGEADGAPADLVADDRLRLVLDDLRGRFDIVLLAAPAATSSQGNMVCLAGDASVLVVTERRSRYGEVDQCLELGERLGVRHIGLVVVSKHVASGPEQRDTSGRPAAEGADHDVVEEPSTGADDARPTHPVALAGAQGAVPGDT